jgi:hypothetical protein
LTPDSLMTSGDRHTTIRTRRPLSEADSFWLQLQWVLQIPYMKYHFRHSSPRAHLTCQSESGALDPLVRQMKHANTMIRACIWHGYVPLSSTYHPKEAMMLHLKIFAQPERGHRCLTLLIVPSNWIMCAGQSGYREKYGNRVRLASSYPAGSVDLVW